MKAQRRRNRLVGIATVVGFIALAATPAYAADNGDWRGSGGYGQIPCGPDTGCFFRQDLATTGCGSFLQSRTRDSDFNNEAWQCGQGGLNDRAKFFWNSFSTLNVGVYRNNTYGVLLNCVPGNTQIGPYPTGVAGGISSFRAC
jgi:hypothetical protein